MSWEDIMRRVLPPIGGVQPHITGPAGNFGAGEVEGRQLPSSIPHGGVDFNYIGGQNRLNKSHPALRSPVDGVVENAGQGRAGRIAIRDKNGFVHEILHTDKRYVAIGDPVAAGQLIGTMGNTGTQDQHVHYQLKDSTGRVVNPTAFWDQQGPIDPNPSLPAYLDQSRRALDIMSGRGENSPPNEDPPFVHGELFETPFGKPFPAPTGTAPPAASDDPASPDDRFGKWGSSPAGALGDVRPPASPAPEQKRSEVPNGGTPTSAQVTPAAWRASAPGDARGSGGVLGKFFETSPTSAGEGASPAWPSPPGPVAPGFPAGKTDGDNAQVRILARRVVNSQPESAFADTLASPPNQPVASPVLGIFSGKPMPDIPLPPSIWGLPDGTSSADDEWYRRWRQMLSE